MPIPKPILVIGAELAGKTIVAELVRSGRYNVLGFIDDHKPTGNHVPVDTPAGRLNLPVFGVTSNLSRIAAEKKVKEIVIAVAHKQHESLLSETVTCIEQGITIHQMPTLYGALTGKIPILHVDEEWIVPRLKAPARDFQSLLTAAMDFGFSIALFLLLFLPSFPFLAVAIKLTSPGPVFYLQKRIGLHGRRFTILKYRTMTVNARKTGESWTVKDDPRITTIGKFLRKFRIDELPQLVNILRGDMALIGPRPEAVDLVTMFKKEIPFYEYRYLVKPGITGWAQVNHTNTCSVDGALTKLQYDLYWIKKRGLLINMRILLLTIRVATTGFGAV